MPFTFRSLEELPEIVLVEPKVFADDRGWFQETYKASDFALHGIADVFVQDNHSRSTRRGVVRGLHFQDAPEGQGKLVRCPVGRVWDVVVDIRRGSPTHGRWAAVELSDENHHELWIPEGFAHGYCTLSEVSEVQYKVTREYDPARDRVVLWDDPDLGIKWPMDDVVLSEKDAGAPRLKELAHGFRWRPSDR